MPTGRGVVRTASDAIVILAGGEHLIDVPFRATPDAPEQPKLGMVMSDRYRPMWHSTFYGNAVTGSGASTARTSSHSPPPAELVHTRNSRWGRHSRTSLSSTLAGLLFSDCASVFLRCAVFSIGRVDAVIAQIGRELCAARAGDHHFMQVGSRGRRRLAVCQETSRLKTLNGRQFVGLGLVSAPPSLPEPPERAEADPQWRC
jgi:hypothetical protein